MVVVGLINQALDTKGLVQLVSVTDFLNSLSSFPINFASSEGIGELMRQCLLPSV